MVITEGIESRIVGVYSGRPHEPHEDEEEPFYRFTIEQASIAKGVLAVAEGPGDANDLDNFALYLYDLRDALVLWKTAEDDVRGELAGEIDDFDYPYTVEARFRELMVGLKTIG